MNDSVTFSRNSRVEGLTRMDSFRHESRPFFLSEMMKLLRKIALAFSSPATASSERENGRRAATRKIVADHSHGNIRLQRGQYATSKDLKRKYERVNEAIG